MRHFYLFLLQALFLSFVATANPNNHALEFVENKGQWEGPFKYRMVSGNEAVYLENNAFTYVLGAAGNAEYAHAFHHGQISNPPVLKYHAYKVSFEGANNQPEIVGAKPQQHYYNYFLGNNSNNWKSGIHPFLSLDYKKLYEGIDMHISSDNGSMKYEFIVYPNADLSQLKLRFDGQDKLSVKEGNLLIGTSVGEVKEVKPYAYQVINGEKKVVACNYKLRGNVVTYNFPNGYDAASMLVIDPTVVFATFTGASADNWGFTATYDAQGNFYAGGLVNPLAYGGSYPVTTGAFQTTFGGGNTTTGSLYQSDIVITKFNPTGSSIVYATFIGGNSNEQPHSLMVDNSNNLVIVGRTYSSNYPTTASAYDISYNGGADLVVTKLNATGTALIGSTYVGGTSDDGVNYDAQEPVSGNLKHNYGDDARSEVILDKFANVYVAAPTKSNNFPVTAGAFQSTFGGQQDGVVFKLNNSLTALTWSTYLGGSNDDAAYVLALDTAQTHLYVAGGTQSSNFPTTGGTYWPTFQGGGTDGYIARFLNSGTYPLQKLTFIGTSGYDQCFGVQVDLDNNVYAMGQTLGGSFPVSPGVYSNPNSSQFIIKLDSNLVTRIYSTVFGSGNSASTNISPVAFLVDTCQNVYISGWGGNLGFTYPAVGNTNGMPLSTAPNLPAQSTTDGNDMYFIVISKNAQSLLYGSYMGGTGPVGEHVDGGTSRFDRNGVIYQAICGGCGGSSNFPTTAGSHSTTNGSPNCNLIAVKIAFNLGAVNAQANAQPNTKGCPPFTVNFQNSSTNAVSYSWNFDDGTPESTAFTPSHTFYNPGVYNVRLAIYNPNACKPRDTAYLTIVVDSNYAHSGFSYNVIDTCGPYTASFTNTSQYSHTPGSSSFTKFNWFFGDGTSYSGATPPVHNYPSTGTYTVMLVMTDSTACNSPDTFRQVVNINSTLVKAGLQGPDSVCLNEPITFNSTSSNAAGLQWSLGDGTTSTASSINYTYSAPGTYTITLIADNPASCNKIDSIKKVVVIKPVSKADFIHTPVIPIANTPVQFTNQSTNATIYLWSFGDGTGSGDVNPSHLYKHTGHYQTCLVARTEFGCADTVCRYVDAEIHTALDLPTGFSPNGDGSNDILFVRGGAIETMNLKIFNRWGELVFETNNMEAGWDGTYKGKPQPVDAYAFILSATFLDGTSAQKQGNVTLIR